MSDGALQYSHSGGRYLLGYGADFFGIWDRTTPGAPVERFPRSDDGWRRAWLRFVEIEPEHIAVGLAPTTAATAPRVPAPRAPASGTAGRTGRAEWWWWLLPFLFALVGGLIAWNRLRERDPRAARNLLWVGIGTTALNLVFYLAGGRL